MSIREAMLKATAKEGLTTIPRWSPIMSIREAMLKATAKEGLTTIPRWSP